MTEEFKKQIETEARQAVTELLAQAKLKKGDVFVVGCSSSEIVGGHIGKDSSLEAAQAVYAGIDIGGTLIGMHLRRVAVPVRLSLSKIGEANILCARTRPKLIGGERAKYTEED